MNRNIQMVNRLIKRMVEIQRFDIAKKLKEVREEMEKIDSEEWVKKILNESDKMA